MIHFGVNISKVKYSLKMNRDEYAIISDKSSIGNFFHFTFDSGDYIDYSKSFILDYLQLVIETLSSARFLDNLSAYRLKQAKDIYNTISKKRDVKNDSKKIQMTIEDFPSLA